MNALKKNNISTRRYFYPSLNKIKLLNLNKGKIFRNSENLAQRILIFPNPINIKNKEIKKICNIINNFSK